MQEPSMIWRRAWPDLSNGSRMKQNYGEQPAPNIWQLLLSLKFLSNRLMFFFFSCSSSGSFYSPPVLSLSLSRIPFGTSSKMFYPLINICQNLSGSFEKNSVLTPIIKFNCILLFSFSVLWSSLFETEGRKHCLLLSFNSLLDGTHGTEKMDSKKGKHGFTVLLSKCLMSKPVNV